MLALYAFLKPSRLAVFVLWLAFVAVLAVRTLPNFRLGLLLRDLPSEASASRPDSRTFASISGDCTDCSSPGCRRSCARDWRRARRSCISAESRYPSWTAPRKSRKWVESGFSG